MLSTSQAWIPGNSPSLSAFLGELKYDLSHVSALSMSWQKTLPGLLLWMLVRRARRSQLSVPFEAPPLAGPRGTSGRGAMDGVGGEMAGAVGVGVEVGADEEATAELEVEVDDEIGMVARGGSEVRTLSSA